VQQSINISCQPGPQQANPQQRRAVAGRDRQTDGQTDGHATVA